MKATNYSTMTTRKNIAQRIDAWTRKEPRFTDHRVDGDIEYAADQCRAAAQIAERFNERMNGVLVVY